MLWSCLVCSAARLVRALVQSESTYRVHATSALDYRRVRIRVPTCWLRFADRTPSDGLDWCRTWLPKNMPLKLQSSPLKWVSKSLFLHFPSDFMSEWYQYWYYLTANYLHRTDKKNTVGKRYCSSRLDSWFEVFISLLLGSKAVALISYRFDNYGIHLSDMKFKD